MRAHGSPSSRRPVRGQFEFLLDAARQGSIMQEDHNYWIDTQVVYAVREVVLELGRRLAANGAVDDAGDVFHLRLEELDDLSADLHGVVAERKAGARAVPRTSRRRRCSARCPPGLRRTTRSRAR